MVRKIWSVTDRIFCHFGPFFALLPPPPPNNPENQDFEKMKKSGTIHHSTWRYHHFTHVYQKIMSRCIYGCDRQMDRQKR